MSFGDNQATERLDRCAPGLLVWLAALLLFMTGIVGQAAAQMAPTLTLASSPNPSAAGDAVTFTARLFGAVNPTAPVVFSEGGTVLASVAVVGDTATFTTSQLAPGTHPIQASYAGDADNQPAAPVTVNHVVNGLPAIVILPESLPSAQVGAPYNQQIQATGGDGGPYAFSLTTGTLPTGLQLTSAGAISGTPESAGSFSFVVQATDQSGSVPGSRNYVVAVEASQTTTMLVSSNNPADVGENVTFTATVSGPSGASIAPTGNVVFTLDGTEQPPVPLVSGQAAFSTSLLAAGDHTVIARYTGDAGHAPSMSGSLVQVVRSNGSVTVRVETGGTDGVFAFSSSTPQLNLSVSTSAGRGESPPIGLPQGEYAVTVADPRWQGYRLVAITCSDGNSAGDASTGQATIRLAAGEAVACTFTMQDAGSETAAMIGQFMERRGTLLLSEQPDIQRRIDRLNGHVSGSGNPLATAMAYLPGIVESGSLSTSLSLAQVRRLSGDVNPSRFDLWFDGSYTRFRSEGPDGVPDADGGFARAALGADWLVNRNLLIGGFIQVDHLSQDATGTIGSVSGTGWLAGPYLTARLTENLFLDLLAAGGTSSNSINPYGTYEDDFSAVRFMASAALQGEWTSGSWTFNPRARFGWFHERSGAYVDSLGVSIPSVDANVGQFAIGPGVSYSFFSESGAVIDTGLRFEAVADILSGSTREDETRFSGRVEASIGVTMPGGARFNFSAAQSGIGQSGNGATTGRVLVAIPLN